MSFTNVILFKSLPVNVLWKRFCI